MKDNSEENKSPKDPMSAAQRQQKHRQRNRELADGASQPSLLDQAKQELADQIDLNLHQLLSQDKFKGQLSSAEIVKLQNWISNHR
jgi:recombinational DNA repair protein (RecF pathway)